MDKWKADIKCSMRGMRKRGLGDLLIGKVSTFFLLPCQREFDVRIE